MESTICRPITPADRFMTYREFKTSIVDFLQQFLTMETRWGRNFEMITENIIKSTVRFQLAWFQRGSFIQTDLLGTQITFAIQIYTRLRSPRHPPDRPVNALSCSKDRQPYIFSTHCILILTMAVSKFGMSELRV